MLNVRVQFCTFLLVHNIHIHLTLILYAILIVKILEEIVDSYDAVDSDQDEWDVPGDFELRNCTRTCFSICYFGLTSSILMHT